LGETVTDQRLRTAQDDLGSMTRFLCSALIRRARADRVCEFFESKCATSLQPIGRTSKVERAAVSETRAVDGERCPSMKRNTQLAIAESGAVKGICFSIFDFLDNHSQFH
jgi:3-methyladenine DNA glycosylase/8-oxoguanine DNA glycosylase